MWTVLKKELREGWLFLLINILWLAGVPPLMRLCIPNKWDDDATVIFYAFMFGLFVPLYLVTAAFIVIQLRPLRVDHHGWQIFLAMLIMAQALRPASWRAGLWGGLFGAALLAAPSRTATRYLPAVPPPFVAKSIPEATRGEPVVRRSNTSSCQFAAPLAGS